MLIRNFMTPDPVTVQPETPVEDIAKPLLAHRINGVPVVDNVGRLLGVMTAEDLIQRGGRTNGLNPVNRSGRRVSGFPSLAQSCICSMEQEGAETPFCLLADP